MSNDDPAPPASKKIAHELFDACNAFKEDSKQWQRIAVAIQAGASEPYASRFLDAGSLHENRLGSATGL